MTVTERVKQRIAQSPLGSEEKMLLRGILGELARSGQDGVGFIHQWIKKNEELRRRTRRNIREGERIDFETQLLRSLLED